MLESAGTQAGATARGALERVVAALPEAVRAELAHDPALEMTVRARALEVREAAPRPSGGRRAAAFFDVDGTLIRGSIVGHMVRMAVSEGLLSRAVYPVFFLFFVLYKLNLIPRRRMYRWGYGLGRGVSVATSLAFVRRCCRERIVPRVVPGVRDLVEHHRAQGHRLVAVTGAPDYAAAIVAQTLGFDDVLATPTPVAGETLHDEVLAPLCYGTGKLPYVYTYAGRHDIDLAASYFYTDSRSDLPLLEAVGHPVCVNPQFLLRIAARRRGWPVVTP